MNARYITLVCYTKLYPTLETTLFQNVLDFFFNLIFEIEVLLKNTPEKVMLWYFLFKTSQMYQKNLCELEEIQKIYRKKLIKKHYYLRPVKCTYCS
jgi:hypothetical protein